MWGSRGDEREDKESRRSVDQVTDATFASRTDASLAADGAPYPAETLDEVIAEVARLATSLAQTQDELQSVRRDLRDTKLELAETREEVALLRGSPRESNGASQRVRPSSPRRAGGDLTPQRGSKAWQESRFTPAAPVNAYGPRGALPGTPGKSLQEALGGLSLRDRDRHPSQSTPLGVPSSSAMQRSVSLGSSAFGARDERRSAGFGFGTSFSAARDDAASLGFNASLGGRDEGVSAASRGVWSTRDDTFAARSEPVMENGAKAPPKWSGDDYMYERGWS